VIKRFIEAAEEDIIVSRELQSEIGYIESPPRERAYKRELGAELDRMRAFLTLES
jgi:hypothetical protein